MEYYQKTVIEYLKNAKREKLSSIIMENLSMSKVRNSWYPGVAPKNSWWGCAARFSKLWPYFTAKNVIFHTRFQSWPQKSKLVFRPGGGQKDFKKLNIHVYIGKNYVIIT